MSLISSDAVYRAVRHGSKEELITPQWLTVYQLFLTSVKEHLSYFSFGWKLISTEIDVIYKRQRQEGKKTIMAKFSIQCHFQ